MSVPQPRQRRAQAAPRHILTTALTMFAERGYDSVTMTAIAQQCGLEVPELMELVADKELLLYPPPSGGFRLVNHMAARPVDESARQALGNSMVEMISEINMDDDFAVLWRRAVARAPEKIRKAALTGPLVRSALITDADKRTPPHPNDPMQNKVLVSTAIAASETAFETWLFQESPEPLLELIISALNHAGFAVGPANQAGPVVPEARS